MENFNTKEIIAVLLKNKKAILIITMTAAIASAVVSFLLKPKYKSIAVVWPVNIYSNDKQSNTEQLLQNFLSDDVKDRVVKKFNLYAHYRIDTTEAGYKALFDNEFKSNVSISPTVYQSVEIEVKDEVPAVAQSIAWELINATNDLMLRNKHERNYEYILASRKVLEIHKNRNDSIANLIADIKNKYNIVDAKTQGKQLAKSIIKNNALSENEKLMAEGIKNKASAIKGLEEILKAQSKVHFYFSKWEGKYLRDYYSTYKFTDIISSPTLPDKKCFPVRWLIVTISSLSALVLSALFFIILNKAERKVD